MSDGRNRLRLQISIATLLWLTLCVASFFGGRYWDRIAKAASTAVLAKAPIAPRVTTALQVQMLAGETHTIDAGVPINRLSAADPTVVRIIPVSDKMFMVAGNKVGSTQVTVWEASTGGTVTYDVSVK